MKEIGFANFYACVKNKLNEEQLRALDPFVWYFALKGALIGLRLTKDGQLWVDIVVGSGVGWMRELKTELRESGFNWVRFMCKPGSASEAFSRYWKGASRILPGEKYMDGSPVLVCELPIRSTR